MAISSGTGTVYSVDRDPTTQCCWCPLELYHHTAGQAFVLRKMRFKPAQTYNEFDIMFNKWQGTVGAWVWGYVFFDVQSDGYWTIDLSNEGWLITDGEFYMNAFNGYWCPYDPDCCPIGFDWEITYDLYDPANVPNTVWRRWYQFRQGFSGNSTVTIPIGTGTLWYLRYIDIWSTVPSGGNIILQGKQIDTWDIDNVNTFYHQRYYQAVQGVDPNRELELEVTTPWSSDMAVYVVYDSVNRLATSVKPKRPFPGTEDKNVNRGPIVILP